MVVVFSVGSVDSGFVVIVDECRCGVLNKASASHIKTIGQLLDGDGNLGTFTGGTDFGFTQAERCLLLADGFPQDRTPHTVQDGTAHASELE